MTFKCENCRYRFEAEEKPPACPRCSSKRVFEVAEKKPAEQLQPQPEPEKKEKTRISFEQRVYGDTKAAWRSFHTSETKLCPDCGGADFDLNWKHKEKICKKCGAILPFGRPR